MKIKKLIIILCAAFTLAHAHAQGTTFYDGTFSDSDWTGTKIYDTTAGQSATFSASQTASGGNPGAFRETIQDYGTGGIRVGDLDSNFIFNPATQGAIASIDFSYDSDAFATGISGAIGYGLVVFQNGSFYASDAEDVVTANQWNTFSHTGLSATDFTLVGGSSNPDFTDTGSPIEFGYYTSNGTGFGTGHTDSGIDNFSVTAVPEPSMSIFGAASALALLLCRKRYQQSA